MQLRTQASLKPLHTFGFEARAAALAEIQSEADLREALALNIQPKLVLGGGSNVLFSEDFPGLILLNRIQGIHYEPLSADEVLVHAGSGEPWHPLVLHSLKQGLGGLENLSLIPGTVGAAPIQNIGAYGVELKDVFHELELLHLEDGRKEVFDLQACHFGYRDSIFKRELAGKVFITRVSLRLQRHPRVNTSYGAIRDTLEAWGITDPYPSDVGKAVVHIRQSKLPDPAVLGNAGSFFKNPEISATQHQALRLEFPGLVSYPMPDGHFKLAAGWLIEQCGFKGQRRGAIGSHEHQALVLVHHGGGQASELLQFAQEIINTVSQRFGVTLEPEVRVIEIKQ
jgi:UDP-N-acetylmuramate dehydrogenase